MPPPLAPIGIGLMLLLCAACLIGNERKALRYRVKNRYGGNQADCKLVYGIAVIIICFGLYLVRFGMMRMI